MKLFKITLILLFSLVFYGCEDFLDVNDNPNNPVSENLNLAAKLPAAQAYTAQLESGILNQLGAFWGGYWGATSEATTRFRKESTFNGPSIMANRDGIPAWENSYSALLYYQLIREQAQTEGEGFFLGIAGIMQGWHFLRLVDLYGDIPFEQALQGTRYPEPVYEDGQEVYHKALSLITEGMQAIQQAPAYSSPGRSDVMFGGNKELWLRFANTVKLRALIRQSQVGDPAYIQTQLTIIRDEGSGFLQKGQQAQVQPGYLNTAGKTNPFWTAYYKNIQGVWVANYLDISPTQFAIDAYQDLSDPRLALLYRRSTAHNTYRGVLFGNPDASDYYNRANTSAFLGPDEHAGKPTALFKAPTQAVILLGDFESLFLQTEAAYRGWLQADAGALYQDAIAASFAYMGVTDAQALQSYLEQDAVKYNQSLERIILQKWLALNSISSLEAWSDYRRLAMPQIPNSLSAPHALARPQRLMYPESEVQSNGRQVAQKGITDITSFKVWWMP